MKKSFPFFIFFFVLSANCILAQQKPELTPDSLYVLSKNKTLPIQQRLQYINHALISNENATTKLKYQSLKTAIYANGNDVENAIKETRILLDKAKAIKDTFYIAKAYYKLGLNFKNKKTIDSAYMNFYRSKKWYLLTNDTLNTVKTLKNLSDINRINGDFYTAEKQTIQGLKLIGNKNQKLSYNFYMQLGISSNQLEDYKSAKNWYSKALKTARNNTDSINTYNSFGVLSLNQQSYEEALRFFDLALKNNNYSKSNRLRIEDNRAYTNGLLKDKSAIDTILNIRKRKRMANNILGEYASNIHLTKLFLLQNNYKQAEVNAEAAYQIAKQINSTDSKIESLGFLIDIKTNNNKEAKQYKHLIDSVNSAKTKLKSTIDKIEFETLEKEKENLKLKAEKAQQAELLAKESKRKWQMAGGLATAILGLGVFTFYYRRNQKQKKVIESLQKELHHRVKNNLSIIDTFIEVTKDDFDDTKVEDKLTELQNRIESINEVHTQLYQNKDITNLNLKEYISKLSNNVQQTYGTKNIKIEQNIDNNLKIDVNKSFPIGLIINEFITNSYKYAFDEESGIITIDLKEQNNQIMLQLSDNGKGLPKNFNIATSDAFGMRIMKLLAQQLKGSFSLDSKNGVTLSIQFPK